jgi:hypothetical protein
MGTGYQPPAQPPPPPPLPPAAIPPTMADASVGKAGANQRARAVAAAGAGFDQTLKTTPQADLVPPPGAKASLLGQTS